MFAADALSLSAQIHVVEYLGNSKTLVNASKTDSITFTPPATSGTSAGYRSIDNTQNITFYLGESVKRITPFNGEEKLNAGRQTVTLTPGNYAIYKIK